MSHTIGQLFSILVFHEDFFRNIVKTQKTSDAPVYSVQLFIATHIGFRGPLTLLFFLLELSFVAFTSLFVSILRLFLEKRDSFWIIQQYDLLVVALQQAWMTSKEKIEEPFRQLLWHMREKRKESSGSLYRLKKPYYVNTWPFTILISFQGSIFKSILHIRIGLFYRVFCTITFIDILHFYYLDMSQN